MGTPRKLFKNPFYKDSAPFFAMEKVSVVFPKEFMLMVHKELSKSYREGTHHKLKSMLFPNERQGWAKKVHFPYFPYSIFYRDLSKSYRQGTHQKLKSMVFPNE